MTTTTNLPGIVASLGDAIARTSANPPRYALYGRNAYGESNGPVNVFQTRDEARQAGARMVSFGYLTSYRVSEWENAIS